MNMSMRSKDIKTWLVVGFLLRLGLIAWSSYQDAHMTVKFTDVDYHVFSDASRQMWEGNSPYLRYTYRYTPFLAFALLPNNFLPWFGKLLFCICDVWIAVLLYSLLSGTSITTTSNTSTCKSIENRISKKSSDTSANTISTLWKDKALIGALFWLFNPVTLAVSSRGNAEAIVLLPILGCLQMAKEKKWLLCGTLLGIATHLKMYPIIYSLPLYLTAAPENSFPPTLAFPWKTLVAPSRLLLIMGFVSSFSFLFSLAYAWYGMDFVENTYLYHISRIDLRHNFSVYFYSMYLQAGSNQLHITNSTTSQVASETIFQRLFLSSFVPQALVQLFTALHSFKFLERCFFLQTVAFVAFNKVFTSQYFLWFLVFLPFVSDRLLNRKQLWRLGFWFSAQALWLYIAYKVEFEGEPLFLPLFICCIILFASHLALIIQ
eukprot:m.43863 g.43863  ORF g.43863 m.43863 type:complete len:432 (-) comp7133_c0_seq1:2157-3452(-)